MCLCLAVLGAIWLTSFVLVACVGVAILVVAVLRQQVHGPGPVDPGDNLVQFNTLSQPSLSLVVVVAIACLIVLVALAFVLRWTLIRTVERRRCLTLLENGVRTESTPLLRE